MAKVIRDVVAEHLGIEGVVGQEVDIVTLLPARTPVELSHGSVQTRSFARNPVYLVVAPFSRVYKTDLNGKPVGEPIPARIIATVDGVTYEGNELFSAEELEVDL
ncbi:hypothetical protein pEaSNUABM56_00230 [Erwinia phage pEa_SNUABM_56]|uniref:Uncharacterized protein n=1 Tax=Erwinia phage pEp_SNUABM_01 TaxID=2601643 RepID=A0A5J6DBP6_9CAUD|nr:hypothetical protein HWC63_gp172 [Erwinia phage pEp_SNUABM_01]QEQ95006.1 hypothetical protein pEpSNUABM01_180 [Erwinia phage pEp_SNUABM_01]UYL85250.1 hypothetical protein pEaSNUABM56_00230 [Erwinia phage pEa_SNUABM_56]